MTAIAFPFPSFSNTSNYKNLIFSLVNNIILLHQILRVPLRIPLRPSALKFQPSILHDLAIVSIYKISCK
jgi:hypothetical protein